MSTRSTGAVDHAPNAQAAYAASYVLDPAVGGATTSPAAKPLTLWVTAGLPERCACDRRGSVRVAALRDDRGLALHDTRPSGCAASPVRCKPCPAAVSWRRSAADRRRFGYGDASELTPNAGAACAGPAEAALPVALDCSADGVSGIVSVRSDRGRLEDDRRRISQLKPTHGGARRPSCFALRTPSSLTDRLAAVGRTQSFDVVGPPRRKGGSSESVIGRAASPADPHWPGDVYVAGFCRVVHQKSSLEKHGYPRATLRHRQLRGLRGRERRCQPGRSRPPQRRAQRSGVDARTVRRPSIQFRRHASYVLRRSVRAHAPRGVPEHRGYLGAVVPLPSSRETNRRRRAGRLPCRPGEACDNRTSLETSTRPPAAGRIT